MLHLIYGNDSYRLREATANLIAGYPGSEVIRVDCNDETAADDLRRHLKYPSFFGDTRIIVASNAAYESMGEVLDEFAIDQIADIVLIAIQDTAQKGYDKKALTRLEKQAVTTTEPTPRAGAELVAWIQSYCAGQSGTIAPDVAKLLAQRVGGDAHALTNELDKLIAYARSTQITAAMIHTLTPPRIERDEWELSNAVASYDKRAVIAALWRKLQEGSPEQMLLGSLAAGMRNLLMVKDLTSRQQPSASIAKATGLHPFVISKTLAGARTADAQRLSRAHIALSLLDRGAKDGRMDMTDGLFAVVLAL